MGFLCAGLYYGNILHYSDSRTEYVAIVLLSMSMGQQSVAVKAMKTPPTILTNVATGAMSDLFSDPRLFNLHNQARDERVAFVLTFFFGEIDMLKTNGFLAEYTTFIGGVISALAYRYSGPQLALLMSAILKLLATIGFFLARPKQLASDAKS